MKKGRRPGIKPGRENELQTGDGGGADLEHSPSFPSNFFVLIFFLA